jgi:hypothetical protein
VKLIETGARYRQGDVGAIDDAVTSTLHGKIGTDTEMADYSLYDMLAGKALYQAGLPQVVSRATAALPQGVAEALFTITGYVELLGIVGAVTTVIETQANDTKLVFNPTGTGASSDMCAVLDISADAVGTYYGITGTITDAMESAIYYCNMLSRPKLLGPGTIDLNCAASNTGSVLWLAIYRPIILGTVTAA